MKVENLKIMEMSDIHLGHNLTTTPRILENLDKYVLNSPNFREYDIIFIAGDFFDQLLHLPDPNVIEIRLWINRFLRMCKKYDIVVRVLEGTPSHDWKQSKLFTHINEMIELQADIKFVEILSIEYIERFGINVLYVPDEWRPETDDTWMEVQQLLGEKNLEQVDFSIMHGAFDYQLPSHVPAPTHVPERYLGITKYLVFIGHVHKHSVRDRIVSAGSFDRLTQGEEEPKGYVEAIVRKDGNFELVFVENKGAVVYKTIDCSGLDLSEALKFVERKVNELPENSFVRIKAFQGEAILSNIGLLKEKFEHVTFTKSKVVGETNPNAPDKVLKIGGSYKPIAITRENITKLLMDRLAAKGIDDKHIEKSKALLENHL